MSILVVRLYTASDKIVELATGRWEVFTTGRVLQYVTVGILENAGPTYAAELSPAALRAALVTFIMVFQALGGVIMTAIFQGINTSDNPNIWYVPIGLMFVPAIICCIGTPFVVGMYTHLVDPSFRIGAWLTELIRVTPSACLMGPARPRHVGNHSAPQEDARLGDAQPDRARVDGGCSRRGQQAELSIWLDRVRRFDHMMAITGC